jgi:hypothetical protein
LTAQLFHRHRVETVNAPERGSKSGARIRQGDDTS